eukprot:Selendium_serpulae@DN3317_c0_g1_i1.p1
MTAGSDSESEQPQQPQHHHQQQQPITLNELEVEQSATVVANTHGKHGHLRALAECDKLQSVRIIVSYIKKLEGLDKCGATLEELELYQNLIAKIENIAHLTKLKSLDLSYNLLRVIEGISSLTELTRLHLTSNKIAKIEGLETLVKLTYLELGANRIRELENLDTLVSLEELWVGKNKLTKMTLPHLPALRVLSFQANRLEAWDAALPARCPNLEELYVSENGLVDIPEFVSESFKKLRILDVSLNRLDSLPDHLQKSEQLEDLWASGNRIQSITDLEVLPKIPKLTTVFLSQNPLEKNLSTRYIGAIRTLSPALRQIDAEEFED